jgi:hypothetical protein
VAGQTAKLAGKSAKRCGTLQSGTDQLTFWGNVFPSLSGLKMQAAGFSEMSINFY